MEIKKTFDLLKNVKNTLDFNELQLKRYSIKDGHEKIYTTLKLIENRIDHFTKKKVFKILKTMKLSKTKQVVSLIHHDKYILPVSYNTPTDTIIINLNYFNTDDISRVDPRNIYACMVYGICFKELITKQVKIQDNIYGVITALLTTINMKLFGKEFGLLGIYSTQIPKMKFLTACYILQSMFDIKSKSKLYEMAGSAATFDYQPLIEKLVKTKFYNINDYIHSLNDFKVMPGLTRTTFAARYVRSLTINFLPALEDCSRFISVITTSNLTGISVVPPFIQKFNRAEFEKILSISKRIFT